MIAIDYKNLTVILVDAFKQNLIDIIDLAALSTNDTISSSARIARLFLLNPLLDQLNISESFNLSEYSLSSNFVINDRINIYKDAKSIRSGIIHISDDFYNTIGH